LAAGPALARGAATLKFETKTQELDAPAGAALAALGRHVIGGELARRLEMTRGLFAVLRGYERNYHDDVRRAGRLTFADVLRLLAPGAGAPTLSAEAAGEARLLIDWRLDARFDHWLLDEFQDTSFAQWSVLKNLIDEAVQDAEGRRSFFYVGDVKQAIFGWRGGDPRLFREIFAHYNRAAPGTIAEGRLDDSWRSGPAVIELVNTVFGATEAIRALVPAGAAAAWLREWRAHASAQPALTGCAELRRAADEPGRFAETLRVLREIAPARRGLTAAVLVRTNATAAALVEFLRREGGVEAIAESDRRIATDNPLTAALLALVRAAAFPGDTLAHAHTAMTPLGAALAAAGVRSAGALTTRVLGEIHADGFAGMLGRWIGQLAPGLGADEFSATRGRMLVQAAAEFDATGSRDAAEFLEFAESYAVRDADAAGAVRVMTVHKAKGLGFDVVILPDLEGKSLTVRPPSETRLAVNRNSAREVEWVMELPAKPFVAADSVLAAHVAAEESDVAYENLCLLYVALTRAKRGMYLIVEAAEGSVAKNFPRLLGETLGESWRAGDPGWFEKIEAPAARKKASAGIEALPAEAHARAVRRSARRPSEGKGETLEAARLFSTTAGGAAAAEFGTAVHEYFAEIEWNGMSPAVSLSAAASPTEAAARAEVLACVANPALAAVWARPPGGEVWRERAFEIVIGEAWFTGVFDRVVIERGADGRAVRATVFDFKTDRVATEAEVAAAVARHAAQLHIYRRAAARLAGIGEETVAAELVLTRLRRRAAVPLKF
ncbi:MAG: hypothetical protein RLZZ15_4485, partial [Verrucomicrobiota bacterium]